MWDRFLSITSRGHTQQCCSRDSNTRSTSPIRHIHPEISPSGKTQDTDYKNLQCDVHLLKLSCPFRKKLFPPAQHKNLVRFSILQSPSAHMKTFSWHEHVIRARSAESPAHCVRLEGLGLKSTTLLSVYMSSTVLSPSTMEGVIELSTMPPPP